MMMLQTMIVKNGLIRINDQYPRSPRQTIRTTKTTSSSFDALSLRDRSSSFTGAVLVGSNQRTRRASPAVAPAHLHKAHVCGLRGMMRTADAGAPHLPKPWAVRWCAPSACSRFFSTLGLKCIDPRAQFAKQVVEARLGRVQLLDPEVDRPYQVADGKEVLAPPLRFALSSLALSSLALWSHVSASNRQVGI